MPLGLLKDIAELAPGHSPLMGLDVGTRTIGIALSNAAQSVATPVTTVMRRKFTLDIRKVADIAADYGAAGFVIGYPLNMDGSAGPSCDRVRSFADEMGRSGEFGENLWIALWDERLSTASVEELVGNDVDIRKAKSDGLIDRMAAQIILQGALEYIADRSA